MLSHDNLDTTSEEFQFYVNDCGIFLNAIRHTISLVANEDERKNAEEFFNLWAQLHPEEHAFIFSDLFTGSREEILSTSPSMFLNTHAVLAIGTVKLPIGVFYVRCMTVADTARRETSGLPQEAVDARPEIAYPVLIPLTLMRIFALWVGFDGVNIAIKRHIVILERRMGVAGVADDSPASGYNSTILNPVLDIMNAGAKSFLGTGRVAPPIARTVEALTQSVSACATSADPMSNIGASISSALKSSDGLETLNAVKGMLGGDPMLSQAFDHLAGAGSMEDIMSRMGQVLSNPAVMDGVKSRVMNAIATASSTSANMANEASAPTDYPIVASE
jgi:hypothetical protein